MEASKRVNMGRGGTVPVPVRPQRMRAGGWGLREDGRGRTVTGPLLFLNVESIKRRCFQSLLLFEENQGVAGQAEGVHDLLEFLILTGEDIAFF